ncbi:peptidase T. Metallo peptidase. MEROPS family M20B [Saccharicrinis carchari]|uniref:Peptidase T n=1 Tax=Saccharicrinis carchari TaxID=1168039 RepID=A0A521B2V5_SACCC|nr:peptidase T [Saccharicrinis carchari]SMO41437.1 peptidase T. Metallo peptidase. MEROPS family M20B [Saccharicrinis carchari]
MTNIKDRFLRYVGIDTQSDTETGLTPSTPGQLEFSQQLAKELTEIGLEEVELDANGYLMATIPSNIAEDVPVIGFIAHVDTSPDFTGKHVKPQIIEDYDGKDIVLNETKNIVMTSNDFPELKKYVGQTLITTDGNTLLGADDKAGVAAIVTAAEYLIQHPEIKHGKIRIGFTPDEEIGAGADHFDVEKFGAAYAYTIDGGEIGELEYENFNAALAKITVHGRNVHPGYAKNKMRNSIRIANQIISMLPRVETPEHTSGYEGFFHLMAFNGEVEKSELTYIIRDFRMDRFEDRKKEIAHLVSKINSEYGQGTATVEIKDQYYNMCEKVKPVMHIVDKAKRAMEEVGVKPNIKPIRGGTDGARLSYMGLPTPNIFAGGHNFHGRFEFVPLQSMEKAVEVIIKIAELTVLEK